MAQTRLSWFRQHLYDEAELSEAERAAAARDRALPVAVFVMGGGGGHRTADGRFYHGGEWSALPEPIAPHQPRRRRRPAKVTVGRRAERD
eukprot:SAG11_NODE_11462_length_759_cov_1.215152_1_plen_89_part_10